jgi:hypothetical protein
MAVSLSALRAGRPLPPGRFLVLISVRGRVDHMAIGIGQLENPMASLGIEPATFRLVALNWYGGGGVWLGPLGIAATNRTIVPALSDYGDGEIGGMISRGIRNTLKKNLPRCRFVHHKRNMLPGRELGPPR